MRILQESPPGICLCVKIFSFIFHFIFFLFSHYFLPAPEDFAGISSWDLSLCQLRSKKGNFCNQLHAGHCCTSIYRPEDIDHDDHDEHEDDDHGDY